MQGKALPDQTTMPEVYVGIDVCKDWLDVYFHPIGKSLRFANDRNGLKRLRRACEGLAIARVVMEATGKYHRPTHRTVLIERREFLLKRLQLTRDALLQPLRGKLSLPLPLGDDHLDDLAAPRAPRTSRRAPSERSSG